MNCCCELNQQAEQTDLAASSRPIRNSQAVTLCMRLLSSGMITNTELLQRVNCQAEQTDLAASSCSKRNSQHLNSCCTRNEEAVTLGMICLGKGTHSTTNSDLYQTIGSGDLAKEIRTFRVSIAGALSRGHLCLSAVGKETNCCSREDFSPLVRLAKHSFALDTITN